MDATPSCLADRFQDLQRERNERFKARIGKLQTNRRSGENSSTALNGASASGSLLEEDDLGLLTATQEREAAASSAERGWKKKTCPRKDVKVPASTTVASEQLHQRVEQLEEEKEMLMSRLSDAEQSHAVLQKKLNTERQTLEGGGGGDPAVAQKIVKLSKRNRALHAELATEKNRVRQLKKEAAEERKLTSIPPVQTCSKEDKSEEDKDLLLRDQMSQLEEDISLTRRKNLDLGNHVQRLKQELKLAHRVIAKEVGEGATVSSLLNQQSGWRGRNQQILNLQNRVSEMKSLLRNNTRGGGGESRGKVYGSVNKESWEKRVETRQRVALEKMERGRREHLETVKSELVKIQSEGDHFRKECSALRARNKILTEELRQLRSNSAVSKKRSELKQREKRALENDTRMELLDSLEMKTEKLQRENQALKQQLQEHKQALHQHQQSQSFSSTKSASLSLPPLVQQPRPPSLSKPCCTRGTLSAGDCSSISLLGRQRSNPGGVASLHQESQIMRRIAETERDRLSELASTYQQRLANAEDQLLRLKTERTMTNRTHPVLLRLPQTPGNGGGVNVRKQSNSATTASSCDKVAALETELAIQKDENSVLRETLTQLRREKLDDVKQFQSTLQDTRRMYIEMARNKATKLQN